MVEEDEDLLLYCSSEPRCSDAVTGLRSIITLFDSSGTDVALDLRSTTIAAVGAPLLPGPTRDGETDSLAETRKEDASLLCRCVGEGDRVGLCACRSGELSGKAPLAARGGAELVGEKALPNRA